jgi:hypothetical protein
MYQGNLDASLYFYKEALKASPTISEYANLSRAIAVVKAEAGYHKLAVKDLEQLVPILRHTEPAACFDILNSYAVELGEVGRRDEARNVIKLALASPYARAYPEWQQTGKDLSPAMKMAKGKPKTIAQEVMYILDRATAELTDKELDSIIEKIKEVRSRSKKDKR